MMTSEDELLRIVLILHKYGTYQKWLPLKVKVLDFGPLDKSVSLWLIKESKLKDNNVGQYLVSKKLKYIFLKSKI